MEPLRRRSQSSVLSKLILVLCLTSLSVFCEEDGVKKVVCYYSSWSHYRQGLAYYEVEDIPVDMCTHVIYAFAVLDAVSLTLRQQDEFADSDNGLNAYRRFLTLRQRKPDIKLLLGLGGWHDSRSDKYSRLVSSPQQLEVFGQQSVSFLTQHGFDGLDLNWEFPAYQGSGMDKEGFRLWVKQLKNIFAHQNLLLTATVSGHYGIIDRGYDIQAIAEDLDLIHLMAYDFHGPWEKQVSHHAPLYPVPGKHAHLSVDFAVKHWIERGAPPSKLLLGISFYGRSWTLAGPDAFPGALASSAGLPGPLLKVPGTSAYFELCLAHKLYDWPKYTRDGGTFLTLYDQWISFDDVDAVRNKTEYVLETDLGGIMVWDISLDDFRNLCGDGINPLLSTITSVLWSNGAPNGLLKPDTVLQNSTSSSTFVQPENEPDRSVIFSGPLLNANIHKSPPITGISLSKYSVTSTDDITSTQLQIQTLLQPQFQTPFSHSETSHILVDQIHQARPLETVIDHLTTLIDTRVTNRPSVLSQKVNTAFTIQLQSKFITSDHTVLQPDIIVTPTDLAFVSTVEFQPIDHQVSKFDLPGQALFMTILPPFHLSSTTSTQLATDLIGQPYRTKIVEDAITPTRSQYIQKTTASPQIGNDRTEVDFATYLLPSATIFLEPEVSFSQRPTDGLVFAPSSHTVSLDAYRTKTVHSQHPTDRILFAPPSRTVSLDSLDAHRSKTVYSYHPTDRLLLAPSSRTVSLDSLEAHRSKTVYSYHPTDRLLLAPSSRTVSPVAHRTRTVYSQQPTSRVVFAPSSRTVSPVAHRTRTVYSRQPTSRGVFAPSSLTVQLDAPRTKTVHSYTHTFTSYQTTAVPSKAPSLYPLSFPMKINTSECIQTGYTKDPTSCSHFYRCHGDRVFRFQCAEQTHWKQELLICDWTYKQFCKNPRALSEPSSRMMRVDDRETFYDEATGAIGYFSHYVS